MEYETYEDILKDICEEVYCYEEFGSYQGDWFAKVKYNGKICWIHGWYGSCSGCDWLQGNAYKDADAIRQSFITEYLEPSMILTQEEAEKEASKNLEWDYEAEKALAFIKKHRDNGYIGEI